MKQLITIIALVSAFAAATVDYKNSLVWGPGLNANFQMPTRYFYVQLVDQKGINITKSQGSVSVSIESGSRIAPAKIEVYDRQDGSYAVNYRPVRPYDGAVMSVKHDNYHLGASPISLKGMMYQENCNCPMKNSDWLEALECPAQIDLLEEQLSHYKDKSLNMRAIESLIHKKFPKREGSGAIVHYVIKNNKIYRKDVGSITGFKIFTDAIFSSLARKIRLPDVELYFNLGDWPQVKTTDSPILPVFSWCGSGSSADIILPTYDVTDASLKSLSQVSIDLFTVQGTQSPNWSDKINKGLFRGRDSRKERLNLVRHSLIKNNSEYIDAGITAFFFFPKDEGLMKERIPFFDFFKYKYQINIDGTVAAYRLPYMLSSSTLVLKQDSEYYEHFYKQLTPYKHYIPLKPDLSDVIEKIQWARDNDQQAEEIARNAAEFMRENVTPALIYCHYYRALQKLSEKISSPIQVLEGMEEVHHSDYMSQCDCHRKSRDKDEL